MRNVAALPRASVTAANENGGRPLPNLAAALGRHASPRWSNATIAAAMAGALGESDLAIERWGRALDVLERAIGAVRLSRALADELASEERGERALRAP